MGTGNRGVAGNVGGGRPDWQNRKSNIEGAIGLRRIVDGRDGAVPYGVQAARIADSYERRQAEAAAIVPAFADDFRADPGRVAERYR